MNQRGFTLLEILIAMAIFTLIGLASTSLLTTVIDSNELSQSRFEKLQQLQRAMLTMERDILQAVARPVRIEGQKTEVVFSGGMSDESDTDAIAFVRGGWDNPQMMLPRSTLQYVAYRQKEGKLERLYGNYVDNVIGHEPKVRELLAGVSEFNVEFLTALRTGNNRDDNGWVDSYQGTSLPVAVAIEFTSEDFGFIRREFTLGGSQ